MILLILISWTPAFAGVTNHFFNILLVPER